MRRHPELFNVGPMVILSHSYNPAIDLANHPLDYRKVLTDDDWRVFQGLFKQLKLGDGIKVYPAGTIFFAVDKVSIWNGDSEKGLVYSERPLEPLVQKLDGRRFDPKVVYKKIKPRWYLYLGFG